MRQIIVHGTPFMVSNAPGSDGELMRVYIYIYSYIIIIIIIIIHI